MDCGRIRVEHIASRTNTAVSEAAALRDKKGRAASGLVAFDGSKLCFEYLSSGKVPYRIFVREDLLDPFCRRLGEYGTEVSVIAVPPHVFERLTDERAPDGIVTVAHAETLPVHRLGRGSAAAGELLRGRTLMLASLQDPGNVGTVLRTALAFGFSRVLVSTDCADPFSPKTLRASMGALFRLPVFVCEDLSEQIAAYRCAGRRVLCAELRQGAMSVDEAHITPEDIIVIGNEGHGIPPALSLAATGSVYLPISKDAESLNASVAAAVFLYLQRNV